MTDCDAPDEELMRATRFAIDHTPTGSEAHVERGQGGRPHRLYVRVAGAYAGALDWGPFAPGATEVCHFYDLVTVARWLKAIVEDACIALRGHILELKAHGAGDADLSTLRTTMAALGDSAGKLMSACHAMGAYEPGPGRLRRVPIPNNTISAETCRQMGSSP